MWLFVKNFILWMVVLIFFNINDVIFVDKIVVYNFSLGIVLLCWGDNFDFFVNSLW